MCNGNHPSGRFPPAHRPDRLKEQGSSFPVPGPGNVAPQNNPPAIWKELGRQYQVREATFTELCEIASALYKAGMISQHEHDIIIFDWQKAATDLRKKYPRAPADFNVTPADEQGRRDWINEFSARARRDFSYNDVEGYINNRKVANILTLIHKNG